MELQETIDALNENIRQLTEEKNEKDKMIQDRLLEIQEMQNNQHQLESSLNELKAKYAQLEKEKTDEFKRLEEMDTEYKKKFRETHSQLQDVLKEKKELEFQVKKLQRDIE
jgi:hypothetical protein